MGRTGPVSITGLIGNLIILGGPVSMIGSIRNLMILGLWPAGAGSGRLHTCIYVYKYIFVSSNTCVHGFIYV